MRDRRNDAVGVASGMIVAPIGTLILALILVLGACRTTGGGDATDTMVGYQEGRRAGCEIAKRADRGDRIAEIRRDPTYQSTADYRAGIEDGYAACGG